MPLCCCLPAGTMYDLKQSKYKKLGKLLDKFSKDKVITQKVVRKQMEGRMRGCGSPGW